MPLAWIATSFAMIQRVIVNEPWWDQTVRLAASFEPMLPT